MAPLNTALRLLGFLLGTGIYLYLSVLLLRRGPVIARARRRHYFAALAVLLVGLWHFTNATALLDYVVTGQDDGALGVTMQQWARVAGWLTPGALVAFLVAALEWPLAISMLSLGGAGALGLWAGGTRTVFLVYLSLAAALALLGAKRDKDSTAAAFQRSVSIALAVLVVAGIVGGGESGIMVLASLAPGGVLLHFIYRYNLYDLLVSHRLVFSLSLGAVSALYLLLVRVLSALLENRFDAFGPVVEVLLVLAAAVLWLPLYQWITRFLSERTALYVDFSKRVIEEASRLLDLGERVQFLAGGVARTFHARRVVVVSYSPTSEAALVRVSGGEGEAPSEAWAEHLRLALAGCDDEVLHARRRAPQAVAALLAEHGFSYLFPLRRERTLTGAMVVDTRPRVFLDEQEPLLLSLSRQISHSIEECRLVDQKIALEKSLLAQEHLAALGNVAATIAHEVKNPLSSIRALAQFMEEDTEVRERYGQDLKHIMNEVDRLNASVRQLLTFSRPAPAADTPLEISSLLESVARALEREHAGAGISIQAEIEPGLRLARGDYQSLQQIVLNLALNAIQASPTRGLVRLRAARRGEGAGEVAISVIDNGPGIPEAMREKIFQPYYTTKQKGTGLGLAIVRKNVRALGGRMEVESPSPESGKGTRMTVVLPAAE